MRQPTFSYVYSDALKLIQHRKHIRDLGLAFELLGLQVDQTDLLPDDLLAEFDDIDDSESSINEVADEEDEFGGDNENWEQDEDFDDWLGDEEFTNRNEVQPRRPVLRKSLQTFYTESFKRSMVAYLLTADDRTKEADAGAPVPESKPIECRAQRIQNDTGVPDAEAWRVARDISDSAPRAHTPGKIDIRACVTLIAQRKPIEILPRATANRTSRDASILIDSRLFRGAFRADVAQLCGALHSMGIHARGTTQQVIRRFSQWYIRDSVAASAVPLAVDRQVKWCVFVTGGESATLDSLRDVRMLTDKIIQSSRVTIVWIGDSIPEFKAEEARKWIAYRS